MRAATRKSTESTWDTNFAQRERRAYPAEHRLLVPEPLWMTLQDYGRILIHYNIATHHLLQILRSSKA